MHDRKNKSRSRPNGPSPPIRLGEEQGEGSLPAFITAQTDGVTLAIKLQPRATKNEIGEPHGPELRIRVTAPPMDAAANEALLRLLSDTLACSRGKVELIRGQTARHKVVKIYGIMPAGIMAKLGPK
ncbi:MAG: DUF167 domain-containing protein [Verrucomicrobia subdivision 3 bacterium]|nr:DUF167 domain-containing protein [Limisphaerales bacterium]